MRGYPRFVNPLPLLAAAWLAAPMAAPAGAAPTAAGAAPAAPSPSAPSAPAASGLRLVSGAGGRAEVWRGSERLGTIELPNAARARGPVRLRQATVQGKQVLEVRVPLSASTPSREEAWVGLIEPGTGLRPIYAGLVGALDADGETSRALTVAAEGIAVHESAARLHRCDGRPVRLGLRRHDFATGRMSDVDPDLPPVASTVLTARRGGKPPADRPRVAFPFALTSAPPEGASGSGLDSLVAPTALNDGDPRTVWLEGAAGDGRGEVLTARAAGSAQSVVGLRLLPGDTRSRQQFQAHARARVLHLSLGKSAEQQFEVILEDDPGGQSYRRPFWVALPKPVPASCLTITVREVTRGSHPREGEVSAFGDIEVFSDLDADAGSARMVKSLGEAGCESRVADVAALGPAAVAGLLELLAATEPPGRDCALQALAAVELPPGKAGAAARRLVRAALPELLVSAQGSQDKQIAALLAALDDPPVEALAAVLGDEGKPPEARIRAARALAGLTEGRGQAALLGAAGRGPAPVRSVVRELLARAPAALAEKLLTEVEGALAAPPSARPSAPSARIADLAEVLGRLPAAHASLRGRAGAVLARLAGNEQTDFEVRARGIRGLGVLDDEAAAVALGNLRAGSSDPVIRRLAARALAGSNQKAAAVALRAAVSDRDPGVREIAVVALGQRGDTAASPVLIMAAKQEPWPVVRRAEVTALGELCGPGAGDLMERAVERDLDEVRRAALGGLVSCKDERAPQLLLKVLSEDRESSGLRTQAAGLLGRLRDPSTAAPMAEALESLVAESQTDLGLESAAVATLRALGAIGGPAAGGAALALRHHPRPTLRRTAVETLARVCDGRSTAALREATRDQDPAVASAAAAGLRRCGVASAPGGSKEGAR